VFSIENGAYYVDGDYAAVITPGDNDLIKFIDEDYLDGVGTVYDTGTLALIDGSGGAFFNLSDKNRKENIVSLNGSLDKVMRMKGYTYQYKLKEEEISKGQVSREYTVVMAQELETVLPQAVRNDNGNYLVCYDQIVPVLIEAMKEQQNEIELLKQRLEALEKK
jgi:hypothetical protein